MEQVLGSHFARAMMAGRGGGKAGRCACGACPSTSFAGPPPRSGEEFLADPIITPERKLAFLDELSRHGNVRVACGRCGLSRSGVYLARRRDDMFDAGWRAALVLARQHVENVLAERALEGVEEPVFYRGEEVARRRRFDSRLLLAHLARLDRLCEEDADALDDAARFDQVLGELVEPEQAEDWPAREDWLDQAAAWATAELAESCGADAADGDGAEDGDRDEDVDEDEDEDEDEYDADGELDVPSARQIELDARISAELAGSAQYAAECQAQIDAAVAHAAAEWDARHAARIARVDRIAATAGLRGALDGPRMPDGLEVKGLAGARQSARQRIGLCPVCPAGAGRVPGGAAPGGEKILTPRAFAACRQGAETIRIVADFREIV